MSNQWTDIILEGYCLYNQLSQKKWELYYFKNGKIQKKVETKDNPYYISKTKRPQWCKKNNKKKIPQFNCLDKGKEKTCPFFAFCNGEKRVYNELSKFYKKEGGIKK